jgi:hypothetical protein
MSNKADGSHIKPCRRVTSKSLSTTVQLQHGGMAYSGGAGTASEDSSEGSCSACSYTMLDAPAASFHDAHTMEVLSAVAISSLGVAAGDAGGVSLPQGAISEHGKATWMKAWTDSDRCGIASEKVFEKVSENEEHQGECDGSTEDDGEAFLCALGGSSHLVPATPVPTRPTGTAATHWICPTPSAPRPPARRCLGAALSALAGAPLASPLQMSSLAMSSPAGPVCSPRSGASEPAIVLAAQARDSVRLQAWLSLMELRLQVPHNGAEARNTSNDGAGGGEDNDDDGSSPPALTRRRLLDGSRCKRPSAMAQAPPRAQRPCCNVPRPAFHILGLLGGRPADADVFNA